MSTQEERPTCPSCGSEEVAWIFYGLPAGSLEQLRPDLDAGRLILGGCCCSSDDPQWRCLACRHAWGRQEFLDELLRQVEEEERRPKGRWERVRTSLGFSFEERTVLDGLARRLVYLTVGAGGVLAVGSIAPAWVGLTVLAIWFLPLLLYVGLRWVLVCGAVALATLTTLRSSPKLLGLFACHLLEQCAVILTFSYLGAWLLYMATGAL
jgi:hypothetical protein